MPLSKNQNQTKRSIKKSTKVSRKVSKRNTRLVKSRPLKTKIKVGKTENPSAKFWCMKCKDFSKSPVERYDKGKTGGTFAKGHCSSCNTKVSLIVKNPSTL